MKIFYVDWWIISGALLGDLLIGDPQHFHPVCFIGKLIESTEKIINSLIKWGSKYGFSRTFLEKFCGFFLFLIPCSITFLISIFWVWLLIKISLFCFKNYYFSGIVLIFSACFFIALKSLIKASNKVEKALLSQNISLAKKELKALVGRDTEDLSEKEIRKATIESLAENLNDGVIAPIFYFILGGFPMMVLYKTVNTLDSMVGYKNEKYINLGFFSAKMDDIFNFIPARLSGLSIVLASFFLLGFKNGYLALKIMLRDGKKHLSPNSGIPEAAIAGALKIKLGGPSYYGGKLIKKPYIGISLDEIDTFKVILAQKIVLFSSFIFLVLALICREILI